MQYIVILLCILEVITVYTEAVPTFYSAGSQKASDDYIVVFRNGVTTSVAIDKLMGSLTQDYAVKPHKEIHIGNFHAVIVKEDDTDIETLLQHPDIAYVEENKMVKALEDVCWEDLVTDDKWGLMRVNRRETVPSCPHEDCVYQYSDAEDGRGVYVYVLDTGIRLTHDEFCNRARWGFTASSIKKVEADTDLNGHGTHVAGTAVGKRYGVAKGAFVIAVKVLDKDGRGSEADILEGVEWAYNDIKKYGKKGVCNLSLGGAKGVRFISVEDAIKSALDDGVAFVLAAGNDNDVACDYSPGAIGDNTAAVTVGATNVIDHLTSFSNYGNCVNILAPGENIKAADHSTDSAYISMHGTSMAAPFVTGVIARYLSGRVNDSVTPAEVKSWIQQQATDDVIDMPLIANETQTPNKLLYMACNNTVSNDTAPAWCTPPPVDPTDPPTTTDTSSEPTISVAYSMYFIFTFHAAIWW